MREVKTGGADYSETASLRKKEGKEKTTTGIDANLIPDFRDREVSNNLPQPPTSMGAGVFPPCHPLPRPSACTLLSSRHRGRWDAPRAGDETAECQLRPQHVPASVTAMRALLPFHIHPVDQLRDSACITIAFPQPCY